MLHDAILNAVHSIPLKLLISKLVFPIVAIFTIIALIKYILCELRKDKLRKCGIYEIDRMGGRVFEEYLHALFESLDFKVKLTDYVKDFGADLVISKDGFRTIVQAKRYKSKVGIKAVQEAVAAKGKYNAHYAMVITNSFYTKAAIELARANKVILWNRHKLVDALSKLNSAKI